MYDLLYDPYELEDLVGLESHRAVKKAMRERLVRRMVEAGEAKPQIGAVPERSSGRRVSAEEASA